MAAVVIRRALIGEGVKLADGAIGKVAGIDDAGVARVVIAGRPFVDVPQDQLIHIRIQVVQS